MRVVLLASAARMRFLLADQTTLRYVIHLGPLTRPTTCLVDFILGASMLRLFQNYPHDLIQHWGNIIIIITIIVKIIEFLKRRRI